jgi:AcrR family transcriptional regulator
MTRRSAAVKETRRRIVDATVALHAEQGVQTTSFEDVAGRADVALATVYRHFPTLEAIVHACGERTVELIHPPSVDDAERLFEGVRSVRERVRRMIGHLCAFYERGAPQLQTAHSEAGRSGDRRLGRLPRCDSAAARRGCTSPGRSDAGDYERSSRGDCLPVLEGAARCGLDAEAACDAITELTACALKRGRSSSSKRK